MAIVVQRLERAVVVRKTGVRLSPFALNGESNDKFDLHVVSSMASEGTVDFLSTGPINLKPK